MTTTTDVLRDQHEQIEALAVHLACVAQDLARVANGTRCGATPAPTAYALLARVKIACRHLGEILAALPQGLHNSLTLKTIEVTDYDPETGNHVAPEKSITHATEALYALHAALEAASRCAEAAQVALANQGWTPVDEQEGLCA